MDKMWSLREILNQFELLRREYRIDYRLDIKGGDYKDKSDIPMFTCKPNEPEEHRQAKEKMFNMVVCKKDLLVITEVEPASKNGVMVFDKGLMYYTFDILVINYELYNRLYKLIYETPIAKITQIDTPEHKEALELYNYRNVIIYCIEVDGKHSKPKDDLRDEFFLNQYNVATARYEVSALVSTFYKKYKRKGAPSKRHMNNFEKKPQATADMSYLDRDVIEDDIRANYKLKSKTT